MPLSDFWDSSQDANEDVAAPEDPSRTVGVDVEANQAQRLKNRVRTEKARQQAALNKLKRKLSHSTASASTSASSRHTSANGNDGDNDNGSQTAESQNWAQRIQEHYFTPKAFSSLESDDPFGRPDYQKAAIERGRAVMSLLLQIVQTLVKLLTPSSGGQSSVQVVLNVCVMDDASNRLRGTTKVDHTNVVHAVMNTVQTLHIQYGSPDEETKRVTDFQSLLVPTPMCCLPSQKTHDLYAAYSAYMLLPSAGLGHALRALQCPEGICQESRWRVHVLVGDALPTNDSLFKLERRILVHHKEERRLAFRQKCLLHAICLVRRPAVLSVDGFWSTLVRLAHLFEQQSFKKKFSMAMIQVLSSPGCFQRTHITCLASFVN